VLYLIVSARDLSESSSCPTEFSPAAHISRAAAMSDPPLRSGRSFGIEEPQTGGTLMAERRLISTGSPFETSYGYSRAVIDGDYVFVAGTTGYDYARMHMPDDVGAQAENCFATIAKVLVEAGSSLSNLVRATYYVTHPEDQEKVLVVAGRHLAEIRPASTMLVVAGLLKPEMKVEIEVTARLRRV
jgi:enamine deaminase RidA (YjgF/YER057c/UK114 family)